MRQARWARVHAHGTSSPYSGPLSFEASTSMRATGKCTGDREARSVLPLVVLGAAPLTCVRVWFADRWVAAGTRCNGCQTQHAHMHGAKRVGEADVELTPQLLHPRCVCLPAGVSLHSCNSRGMSSWLTWAGSLPAPAA